MWHYRVSVLIGWVIFMAAAPAAGEQRIALVIGNAGYSEQGGNWFKPLANPVKDAADMQQQLEAFGFVVTREIDTDEKGMNEAVGRFIDDLFESKDAQTVGLFYYSGHGVQIKGKNYLIPVGVEFRNVTTIEHHALNAQTTLDRMTNANAQLNIMVLDACRVDLPSEIEKKGVGDRGFAKMTAALGSIVGYAAKSGQAALGEKEAGKNSVYTKHLLNAMQAKSHQPIELVFKETRAAVVKETDGQQIPGEDTNLMAGDFCFGGCGQPTPTPQPTPSAEALLAQLAQQKFEQGDVKAARAHIESLRVVNPRSTYLPRLLAQLPPEPIPTPPSTPLRVTMTPTPLKVTPTPKPTPMPAPTTTPPVKPQTAKIQLRSMPLTVTENEGQKVFGVDKNWRPLKYIDNDFEDQGDMVVDHATGLMWQKSGSDTSLTYQDAQAYIDTLNRERLGGYADWRLPTVPELLSLITKKEQSNMLFFNPIFGVMQRWCWSADRASSAGPAWYVNFMYGEVHWFPVVIEYYVRGVRAGQ